MRIAMALLSVSLAFASACKKEKKAEPTAGSAGSAQTTGSAETGSAGSAGSAAAGSAEAGSAAGSAAAGSGDTAGSAAATTPMQNKGGNCPSLVSGATTKAELKDGKVILTISATDKDAIAAIQTRTKELLEAKAEGGGGGGGGNAHDQKGTHGGGMGLCPVHVQEGGKAEAKNNASGVVVTLTPKNNADAYKAEIDSRIAKSAEWAKANVPEGDKGTTGGVGGGKGEHGMNHSGEGDGKGQERKGGGGGGGGDGKGGGKGTGGGGGMGTGGGGGKGGEKSK